MVKYSNFVDLLNSNSFLAQADALAFRNADNVTSRQISGYDLQRSINILEANVTLGSGLTEIQKNSKCQ